jgi:hypothetical protein
VCVDSVTELAAVVLRSFVFAFLRDRALMYILDLHRPKFQNLIQYGLTRFEQNALCGPTQTRMSYYWSIVRVTWLSRSWQCLEELRKSFRESSR